MSLERYDFVDYYLRYKSDVDNGLLDTKRYKLTIVNKGSFLFNIIPYLGGVIAQKNESGQYGATETLKWLNNQSTIETANGTYDARQIGGLIKLLCLQDKSTMYSDIKKSSSLAGLTPSLMHAIKEDQNIGYNEWDRNDENLDYFLGKYLKPLVKEEFQTRDKWEDIRAFYDEVVIERDSSYFGVTRPRIPKEVMSEYADYLPSTIPGRIMALQIWLARDEVRDRNMILDPYDWELIPESYHLDPDTSIKKEILEFPTDIKPSVEDRLEF